MHKILFVDDDEGVLELLSFLVQRDGFRALRALDAATTLQLLVEERPDLLVLDIRLGAEDGLALLATIRRLSEVPVIMLSSLDSQEDIERALDLGADDYIVKPFAFREFVARVRAVLRRACTPRPLEAIDAWIRVGPLALNSREHKAMLEGLPLELTRTEFRLLQFLIEHSGRVVPLGVLLKQVWEYDDPTATDVVRAAIYRLRRKLGHASSGRTVVLRTFPGHGVMLQHGGEDHAADGGEEFLDRVTGGTRPMLGAA